MNFEDLWNKALKETEIIRSRVQGLMTFSQTKVPYILLSESSINVGDTVVRQGQVLVDRPTLFIPPNNPQFEGFEFADLDQEGRALDNAVINFFVMRGVSFPSLRYDNKTMSLDVFEGKVASAIKHYEDILQRKEDTHTGLITAPEDCWQFSLLIFICSQIARNVDSDFRKLLDEYRKRKGLDP